jgi:hypothetical protein
MDSYNARYMVELLAVRPRFSFVGTFVAFTDYSECYSSSQRGQDSKVYIHACDTISLTFRSPYLLLKRFVPLTIYAAGLFKATFRRPGH